MASALLRLSRLYAPSSLLPHASSICRASSSASTSGSEEERSMDFPGGRVRITSQLTFVGGPELGERQPCYRTTDSHGRDLPGAQVPHALSRELASKIYSTMATLQVRREPLQLGRHPMQTTPDLHGPRGLRPLRASDSLLTPQPPCPPPSDDGHDLLRGPAARALLLLPHQPGRGGHLCRLSGGAGPQRYGTSAPC